MRATSGSGPAAVALITLLLTLACSSGPAEFPAADFTLKSPMTDRSVAFSDLKGRPVIIYWFASW